MAATFSQREGLFAAKWLNSSVVEHLTDIQKVAGLNPASDTQISKTYNYATN